MIQFTWANVRLDRNAAGGAEQPKVAADRAVLFEKDTPICSVNLINNPEMAPAFVALRSQRSDSEPTEASVQLDAPPTCGPDQMATVSQITELATHGTRTGAFPLVAVPVAVCAVSAWVGEYVTSKHMGSPAGGEVSAWTWGSAGAAPSAVILVTGAFTLPAGYAAAYGGLLGAGCSIVGSMIGVGFYQRSK